jgi:hypothetical protein
MKPYTEQDIYQSVHSYAKIYPDFTRLYKFDIPIKVRVKGYEERYSYRDLPKLNGDYSSIDDSIRRTKTKISDIIICNDFDWFITFTFKRNRQDITKIKKQFSKWISNIRDTHGNFQYLFVPEFHKDGKSIHFHGLVKNLNVTYVPTSIYQNGKQVHNIKNYKLGFTNATKILDKNKTSSYVKKYITKDMPKLDNKKRYWVSTQLKRPEKITNPLVDPFLMDELTPTYTLENLTMYQTSENIILQLNKGARTWTPQTLTEWSKKSISLKEYRKKTPLTKSYKLNLLTDTI